MLKRLLSFILCLSLICPLVAINVRAAEKKTGYLLVRNIYEEKPHEYKVLYNKDEVYIKLDDLSEVCHGNISTLEEDEKGPTVFAMNKGVMSIEIRPKENEMGLGKKKIDGCMIKNNDVYVDIMKVLDFLNIKARINKEELLIDVPPRAIVDYLVFGYWEMKSHPITLLDLLNGNETELITTCNNFDSTLLVPYTSDEKLTDEEYAMALQTLDEEDASLYEGDFQYLDMELAELEKYDEEVVAAISQLEEFNYAAQQFGISEDPSSILDVCMNVYIYAKNCKDGYQKGLELLGAIDVNHYDGEKGYAEQIKELAPIMADEPSNEVVDPTGIAAVQHLLSEENLIDQEFFNSQALEFIKYMSAEMNGNLAEGLDKEELYNIIKCLININFISREEARKASDELWYHREDITPERIDQFRQSCVLSAKSNLRAWNYVYYLKSDGNWEYTEQAQEVKDHINILKYNLLDLQETEKYDEFIVSNKDDKSCSTKDIIKLIVDEARLSAVTVEMTYPYTANDIYEHAIITGLNKKNEEVWRYEVEPHVTGERRSSNEIGIFEDNFYWMEENILRAFRVSDGEELWQSEMSFYCGGAIGNDGTIYIQGYDGYLYIYNTKGECLEQSYLDCKFDGTLALTGIEGDLLYYNLYPYMTNVDFTYNPKTQEFTYPDGCKQEDFVEESNTLDDEDEEEYYEENEEEDGGICGLTLSQACEKIASHYNMKENTDVFGVYEGDYMMYDGKHCFLLRTTAMNSANVLVGLVAVDPDTGSVSMPDFPESPEWNILN